jgi:hypothetical protein
MKESEQSKVDATSKFAIEFLSQGKNHQGPDILRQTLKLKLYDYVSRTKAIANGILIDNHQIIIPSHFILGSGKKGDYSFPDEPFDLEDHRNQLERFEIQSNIDADNGRRDLVVFDHKDKKLLEIKDIKFQDLLNGFDERVYLDSAIPARKMRNSRIKANKSVGILRFSHDFSDDLQVKSLPFQASLPQEGGTAYLISYRQADKQQLQHVDEIKLDGNIFGIGSNGMIENTLVKASDPQSLDRSVKFDLGAPLIIKHADGKLSINGFKAGKTERSFYLKNKLIDSEIFTIFTDQAVVDLFDRNEIAIDKTSAACVD